MTDEEKLENNFVPGCPKSDIQRLQKFMFDRMSSAGQSNVKRIPSESLRSLKNAIHDGHLHIKKRHLIHFHVNNIFIMIVSLGPI